MSLRLDDVRRIAELARLEVTAAELDAVRRELNGILGLVEQLQAVETGAVAPMAHAQNVTLRLRDDAVTATDERAASQSVAPAVDGGLYLVPKVIE
ncbi:MAG: Asp-tRNA(Asn)/Glu-tRNA(Gln) amidotransferase subunit GatC [Chloroflexi bacterium]|nr:Asp-tRNA(Asn)/Glu-tRNA(Gln) amidotransferase subunit GatC [Chloroflexota bacterium]